MTIVYRLINRIETFEEFGEDWGMVNHHHLMEYLEGRKEGGKAVFTQAHNTMGRERLRVLMQELVLRIDVITEEILMAQTLEQCVDLFRTFSNIENFFSWQIICDLLEENWRRTPGSALSVTLSRTCSSPSLPGFSVDDAGGLKGGREGTPPPASPGRRSGRGSNSKTCPST